MTEILIEESGMWFGPFDVDDCFAIEQSPLDQRIRQGVKIAEMAVLRQAQAGGPTVWIIEAKSSSPRPAGTDDDGRLERSQRRPREEVGSGQHSRQRRGDARSWVGSEEICVYSAPVLGPSPGSFVRHVVADEVID